MYWKHWIWRHFGEGKNICNVSIKINKCMLCFAMQNMHCFVDKFFYIFFIWTRTTQLTQFESNLTLLKCIYDSLHFGVKITLSKVWNIYITYRVHFNSIWVKFNTPQCIYDSLRLGVKITLSKVWNMYITQRVHFNTMSLNVLCK